MLRPMELFDALGPDIARELSQLRDRVPKYYFTGADAAAALASALAGSVEGRRAGLVSDQRTHAAAGEDCQQALRTAGFEVHGALLPDAGGHEPVCDEHSVAWLDAALPEVDVVVGVGSGVVNDLSKWVATKRERPGAIFATAASMNGYAAANIAPAVGGVKTLVHGRAHLAIAADPRVLGAAPRAMTAAGLGDVIAKCVSTADWRMNDLLFGEAYSPAVAGIIDGVQARFLSEPERLGRGDPDSVTALLDALVYSGCAMTLQGSSMPASGGEHLISHALDMRAMAEGVRHDLHGRQVGLGTIFAAALYDRVLACESPRFSAAPLPLDRAGWGPVADEVAVHHAKQGARLADACAVLSRGDTWDRLRQTLSPMLPGAQWVKDVLSRADAAHRIEHIGIDRARFTWAVRNGAQIRERFTSLDLGWTSGVLPDAIDEIIDQYLL